MEFVSVAYDHPSTGGQFPNANSGWEKSQYKHPGDRNPPRGAPVYFSGFDGHVCMATGSGDEVWTTDRTFGVNGYWSISGIESQWEREYYGWTGDICSFPITFAHYTPASITTLPTGVPMFTLSRDPGSGIIYVHGIDDRKEGVQSADHLNALVLYRKAMLRGDGIEDIYYGDFVGTRGCIDWYLGRVNGPRPAKAGPVGVTWVPTDEELAAIGQAARVDVNDLLSRISKLDDAEHAQLLAAINKPRTVS